MKSLLLNILAVITLSFSALFAAKIPITELVGVYDYGNPERSVDVDFSERFPEQSLTVNWLDMTRVIRKQRCEGVLSDVQLSVP